jgi:hypothetical protein
MIASPTCIRDEPRYEGDEPTALLSGRVFSAKGDLKPV